MQKFKELKYVQRVLVFLLAFCIVFAGSFTDAMAKSKKAPAVKSISLKIGKKKVTKKTYKMKSGEKKKIKVSVSPKKGKNVVQFATSNRKVVAVNKKGTVTAKKTGTAKIKVTVKKGISKKKGRASKKKTTWVKIKVAKASNPKDKRDSDMEPPSDQNTVKGKKSLVVYFSCTNTTKKIAEYVQQSAGADIYRIEAAVPYTAEDLNYGNADSRTLQEQNNPSARPAIAGNLPSLDGYEIVYLGYPLWFGQAPKIMYTLIESYNLSGKIVIPFCTSHSSGIGTSATNLQTVTRGNAAWIAGQRFSGSSSKADIEKWINNLDLSNTTSPTGTIPVTPKPEEPTPPSTETPVPDETLPPSESETPTPSETPEPGSVEQGKSLVVYFSCTDTTKRIAEYIQENTGADIYRIEAQVPYTAEDLNYGDASTRATREQNDSSARPAIAGKVENMAQYQNVVIAYPIWWGQAPRIISTFLESYDFSGKTIVLVCTSHSSGIGSSATNLHALTDSGVTWLEGRRFSSTTTKEEVAQWLNDSGIQELLAQNREETMERVFDFGTKTVTLNSGYKMPLNGIGTYSLTGDTCVNSVSEALKRGVRLIDTAYMYHNEAEVGEAVRNSGIPRSEIFVITKLYPNQFSEPEKAIDEALEKLDIQYIDMLLLHHPGTDDVKAYQAMEKAVREGKIRSIGLSNWYIEELEEFLPQVSITPALVQNEIHPYYQENDVIPYIQNLGIVVQGWYPLGGRGHTAELLSDEVISFIAEAHGKSSAQVILRWNLQKGVVVIPGSSNPAHIQENTELYDFELTDEEMAKITALDRNEKHDWY